MPRINVPFIVEGQNIRQYPKVKIAAGGQNYFYATFNTCNVWDDLTNIKASFDCKNLDKPIIVDLVKGIDNCLECEIPWEIMQIPGHFDVGIFGGSKLPTIKARTFVIEGCACDGDEPRMPTPDWFTEIEKKLPQVTASDYGKLLYCSEDGQILPLRLGNGLEIINGMLMITNFAPIPDIDNTIATLGIAKLGQMKLGNH